MPDITIVTEVAGRVCAIHVEAGASIADGDEVAFVDEDGNPGDLDGVGKDQVDPRQRRRGDRRGTGGRDR